MDRQQARKNFRSATDGLRLERQGRNRPEWIADFEAEIARCREVLKGSRWLEQMDQLAQRIESDD